MTRKKGTNELTEHCKRRANWINHLEKNLHRGADLDDAEKQKIIQWAIHARMEDDHGIDTFQHNVCNWING